MKLFKGIKRYEKIDINTFKSESDQNKDSKLGFTMDDVKYIIADNAF